MVSHFWVNFFVLLLLFINTSIEHPQHLSQLLTYFLSFIYLPILVYIYFYLCLFYYYFFFTKLQTILSYALQIFLFNHTRTSIFLILHFTLTIDLKHMKNVYSVVQIKHKNKSLVKPIPLFLLNNKHD